MSAGPWTNGNSRISPAGGPSNGYSTLQQKGGAAGTDHTSTTSPMEQQYENLRVFFGEAPRDRVNKLHSDDWDDYQKENSDYPDAFTHMYGTGEDGQMSKNGFLSRTMIEKTVASLCWQVTRMAPWREHNSSLVLEWSCAKFDQHLLDKLPEESAPRLLSSSRSSGRASLLRHGIALLLEATFAETPLGRFTYLMHLEQMRVATVETACYGAMIAILEHQEWRDPAARHSRQDAFTANAIDNMFKEEVRMWGIVHKHADGFEILKNKQSKALSSRGSGASHGNFTVIPQGMAQFLSQSDRSAFYMEGPGTDAQITKRLAHSIVDSREFSQGENNPGHDPVFRQQTIGGFMTLDDSSVQTEDVAKYRTSHLDSLGYDEDKDSYYMFRYAQHYKYAGVWNFEMPDAPCTDNIGRGFLRDMACYTWAQTYAKCRDDGTARVVDKLHLLAPEKRQAFFDSLHLLPADSACVDLGGYKFPRASNYDEGGAPIFDARQFDAVCIEDVAMSQTVTAPEAWRYEQRGSEMGTFFRAADRAADERVETAAGFSRKRAFMSDLPDEDVFKMNKDEMETDETVVDYRRLPDGRMAKVETKVVARNVRRRFALDETQQQQAAGSIVGLKVELNALAAARNSVASDAAATLITRIEGQPGASDADKLIQLRETKRVFQGELQHCAAPVVGDDDANMVRAETFAVRVTAHMAQFLGAMAVRAAIDGVTVDRTPLEDACKDRSANLHTTFPDAVVDPCWWAPDGEFEDGQVKLATTGFASDPTIALPHDSFASTLAANNLVVFDLADAVLMRPKAGGGGNEFHPTIKEAGAKRSRIDALVWSIAVSHLTKQVMAAAIDSANLFDKIQDFVDTKLSDKTKKRLVRDKGLSLATKQPRDLLLAQSAAGIVAAAVSQALSIVLRGDAAAQPDAQTEFDQAILASNGLLASATMDVPAQRAQVLRAAAYVKPKSAAEVAAAAAAAAAALAAGAAPAAPVEEAAPAGVASQVVWTKPFILSLLERASLACGNFLKFCVENDVPVPYYLRLWRPSKAYNMGSMIRMQADGAAAYTFFQMPVTIFLCTKGQGWLSGADLEIDADFLSFCICVCVCDARSTSWSVCVRTMLCYSLSSSSLLSSFFPSSSSSLCSFSSRFLFFARPLAILPSDRRRLMRRRSAFQSKPAVFSLKCSTKAGASSRYWCCANGVSAMCALSASVQRAWQNEQWTTAAPDRSSSMFLFASFARSRLCAPPRKTCDTSRNPSMMGSSLTDGTRDAYGIEPCSGCWQCTRSFQLASSFASGAAPVPVRWPAGTYPFCLRVCKK